MKLVSDSDPPVTESSEADYTRGRADLAAELDDERYSRRYEETYLPHYRANIGRLLATEPPGRNWLIHERIELGRGVLLTGLGGSSKTRFLYQLAVGAIVGRLPWDWTVAARGSAVLVLTEDTHRDVHETIHGVCQGLDLDLDERRMVEQRLDVFALAGHEFRLLDTLDGRTLFATTHAEQVREIIAGRGDVAFVGLDPALALTAGDELNQGHQRQLGKLADDLAVRTGAAVVLTAHATKGSLNQDRPQSHASRGAGAITDAVRGEFSMRTMTATEAEKAGIREAEERTRHVQLVATKGNHIPPAAFAPVWLRRGEHGILEAAEVTLDATESNRAPGLREVRALKLLDQMQREHVPTLAEWRSECVRAGILPQQKDNARTQAMKRIVGSLRDAGYIERGVDRGRWVITEAGRCAVNADG